MKCIKRIMVIWWYCTTLCLRPVWNSFPSNFKCGLVSFYWRDISWAENHKFEMTDILWSIYKYVEISTFIVTKLVVIDVHCLCCLDATSDCHSIVYIILNQRFISIRQAFWCNFVIQMTKITIFQLCSICLQTIGV